MSRIGFIINPVAGMGGRVGLKGTDGVAAEAMRLGAEPIANMRAIEALWALKHLLDTTPGAPEIEWLTVSGAMGRYALRTAGFATIEVVHEPPGETSVKDTRAAVEKFLTAGVDLVLFCGGDGTARDICGICGEKAPILGIPSGVKMYSGVFGITPAHTAEILLRYLRQEIGLASAEILDLDGKNTGPTNGRCVSTCRRGRSSSRPMCRPPRRLSPMPMKTPSRRISQRT
jgi:predicted polyphosphate/ATP-dependent NAD kinase